MAKACVVACSIFANFVDAVRNSETIQVQSTKSHAAEVEAAFGGRTAAHLEGYNIASDNTVGFPFHASHHWSPPPHVPFTPMAGLPLNPPISHISLIPPTSPISEVSFGDSISLPIEIDQFRLEAPWNKRTATVIFKALDEESFEDSDSFLFDEVEDVFREASKRLVSEAFKHASEGYESLKQASLKLKLPKRADRGFGEEGPRKKVKLRAESDHRENDMEALTSSYDSLTSESDDAIVQRGEKLGDIDSEMEVLHAIWEMEAAAEMAVLKAMIQTSRRKTLRLESSLTQAGGELSRLSMAAKSLRQGLKELTEGKSRYKFGSHTRQLALLDSMCEELRLKVLRLKSKLSKAVAERDKLIAAANTLSNLVQKANEALKPESDVPTRAEHEPREFDMKAWDRFYDSPAAEADDSSIVTIVEQVVEHEKREAESDARSTEGAALKEDMGPDSKEVALLEAMVETSRHKTRQLESRLAHAQKDINRRSASETLRQIRESDEAFDSALRSYLEFHSLE